MCYTVERKCAEDFDRADELQKYRRQFYFPETNGKPYLYFCGNSLGLQPQKTEEYVQCEIKKWQQAAVEGHFTGERPWMDYHEFLTTNMANLVGGKPIEVVAMNSLTTNLHLLMVSFYRPTPQKNKILIEKSAFPSDRYAVESQIRFHGYDPKECLIEISPPQGEYEISDEAFAECIAREGKNIALILLGGVNYYTGQLFPMEKITKWGHEQNCVVGFDLAHAIGNIPLELHKWQVDFAVWCTYKYLNGGPGGVGGSFVHERYAEDSSLPRFCGWWGHEKSTRFAMPDNFEVMSGAEGWQLSNAPVLSMAALIPSLEIFAEVGMDKLRTKSLKLTSYFEFLLQEKLSNEVEVITPKDTNKRGAQLSLHLKKGGKEIHKALLENGVICDWREPNSIRVAPVPLYNNFLDVWLFVETLETLLKDKKA
ncbi:kynureninase [Candidatus Uabimicrobium sp. HlEnr_7]|uniref:kynureninase n=1 Tax=Candidatus Uabimicrobium helgolandensis TaxID=3095367 RepID=UPI0035586D76